jgi:hypothetical protein
MDIFENQKKARLCVPVDYGMGTEVLYLTANLFNYDNPVPFVDTVRADSNNSWWDIHPVSPGDPSKGYKLSNQGYYISNELTNVWQRNFASKVTDDESQAAVFLIRNTNDATYQRFAGQPKCNLYQYHGYHGLPFQCSGRGDG